jgi:hypothetical protein
LQEVTGKLAAGVITLPEPAARDDWKTLRANGEAALAAIEADLAEHPEVYRTGYAATSHDGATVPRCSCAGTPRQGMTPVTPARQRYTCTAAG